MLKFLVLDDGQPARQGKLRNAHLLGSDRSAMRAEITFEEGAIYCQKREAGPASLSLQYHAGDCGELTLSTCLLPERNEPYLLSLELARQRLMLIYNKLEDWSMFELGDDHAAYRRIDRARRLFIEALCALPDDIVGADKLSKECLAMGVDASEELALAHADLLLTRRKAVGLVPRSPIGCGVTLNQTTDKIRATVAANFDFVYLPMPWRHLAPAEGEYQWTVMDNWAEWATRTKMPVIAGPVVSFEPAVLPDWVYIWEHDYEAVRDLLYQHTERVVTRYKNVVAAYNVVSGLHVNSHFTFSFDQLMELTRLCIMLVKKTQPAARALVEIRQPFGEYYAANSRSIPPLMYADLLVQGAVNFDGFALRLIMGQAVSGQFARDLMQISNLLDQFAAFGKPVHLTIASPSETVSEVMIAATGNNEPVDPNSGYWRKPWSELVQSRWLETVFNIALSKPFVESVAWDELVDHADPELPLAGLINDDLQPKQAFRRLVLFRRSLLGKAVPPVGPAMALSEIPMAPPIVGNAQFDAPGNGSPNSAPAGGNSEP